MPTYLDFDSTKSFRDILLNKTLQVENGPQTFTANNYTLSSLNTYSNIQHGSLPGATHKTYDEIQSQNTFKPLEYTVTDSFSALPRRANLGLYPYFNTNLDHTLTSVLISDNFESESELFKFNANYIKNDKDGPLQSRIKQNLNTATLGRVRLLDAIDGNLATLTNIVTGKEPLIELNNSITVSSSLLGNVVDFAETVAGVTVPWSEIPGDYLTNPTNNIQNPISTVIDAIGKALGFKNKKSVIRPSDLFLEYMGSGPKRALFENLSYSKYAPNYESYSSLLYGTFDIGKPYIGDDRGNDVKLSTSDLEERVVRGPYSLSLMFDDVATKLYQKDKNVGDGGSISGSLTWYNSKRKSKIGFNNLEYESESSNFENSLSTKHKFRENSILSVTQDLIDSMPLDNATARSHVGNAIDQTSRLFRDGDIMMSKGSAIKYVNNYSKLEDGTEYCRVWTKDRSYMNYSDTMKRTGLIRKYDSSVMSKPWNLNIGPMSNGNKGFDESTNMVKNGDGFSAKKYMFSIENLSWKSSNKPEFTYEDLPYCERGPNGGRIMWFPPYGVEINETNGVRWEDNVFVGRPEPIYTYQSTTRGANLKFKIIVDHPSILNLLTREHFKNMSDEESDNYINAFFAGCEEVDFYDLIKRYVTLTTTDIEAMVAYLNGGKDPGTIKRYRTKITPEGESKPSSNKVSNIEIKSTLYFNNGKPENGTNLVSNESFGDLYNTYNNESTKTAYKSVLNGALDLFSTNWDVNKMFDFKILTKIDPPSTGLTSGDFNLFKSGVTQNIDNGFSELNSNYTKLTTGITELKSKIKDKKVKNVTISIESSASAVDTNIYNLGLSYRRSYSVILEVLKQISNDGNIDSVKSKIVWKNTIKKDTKSPQTEFDKEPLIIKFSEIGYPDIEGNISFKMINNYGEEYKLSDKKVSCDDSTLFKSSALKRTAPEAFWCRQSTINIKYSLTDFIEGKSAINKISVEEYEEKLKSKPTIDVLKKIVMKVLNESYYFKKLEENSPLQFSSLKEKLRYFHPSFHSMTPEGLNSRLTFLHQCIRPGDTIPIKGIADGSDLNSRNTSFGPPPIIILRFGDFYNTKAIIRDLNISFDQNLWDLNPEGIGVQPMIADVTLSLSFFGGQGMEKPVNELQNALSSNFYANTEVYDYRSTATEDRTKFTKEVLSDILKYKGIDLTQTNNDQLNTTKTNQFEQIGIINTVDYTISYESLVNDLFKFTKDYFESYVNFLEFSEKKYGRKIMSLMMSEKYRTVKDCNIVISDNENKFIKMLGNYSNNDLFTITTKLNDVMVTKVSSENIALLLKLTLKIGQDTEFNETINSYLKQKITTQIETITQSDLKSVLNKRNKVIGVIDKLNYIVKFGQDGYVYDNNKTVGYEIIGFSDATLYSEYVGLLDFINIGYEVTSTNFDDTFDVNNITPDVFFDVLKTLIITSKEDVVSFVDVFKKSKQPYFNNTEFLGTLTGVLNDLLLTVNTYTDSTEKFTTMKNSLVYPQVNKLISVNKLLTFPLGDEILNLSSEESDGLLLINKTNSNNTTTHLNFTR